MFKIYNKKNYKKETFTIIFCNENDPTTKFGEYTTCKTYEEADHIIRMAWNKKKEDRINNGYRVKDAWIIIEKTS